MPKILEGRGLEERRGRSQAVGHCFFDYILLEPAASTACLNATEYATYTRLSHLMWYPGLFAAGNKSYVGDYVCVYWGGECLERGRAYVISRWACSESRREYHQERASWCNEYDVQYTVHYSPLRELGGERHTQSILTVVPSSYQLVHFHEAALAGRY